MRQKNRLMTVARRSLSVLGLLLATSACAAGCGSTMDDRPPRWSVISPTIVQPSCASVSCHSEIAQTAGVDLHDRAEGWDVLVGRLFVEPGNRNDSELMWLLRGEGNIRMPPDFVLPAADIELIGRWIDAGATYD